jgi:hypothetical protein
VRPTALHVANVDALAKLHERLLGRTGGGIATAAEAELGGQLLHTIKGLRRLGVVLGNFVVRFVARFLAICQRLICFLGCQEPLSSLGIIRILVRMPLQRQHAIGTLNFGRVGVL